MLTQLTTIKNRLAIASADTQYDALLTNAICAISARFDRECRRTLARTVNAAQEFDAVETEFCVACYPIETVARFEVKAGETGGWVEQPAPEYLIRAGCIISLSAPLGFQPSTINHQPLLCRVIYTGGYVLPDAAPEAGQTALPADLEQAAVEQAAFWFANRDRVGVIREWPKGGLYQQFVDIDLVPSVRAVLAKYARVLW